MRRNGLNIPAQLTLDLPQWSNKAGTTAGPIDFFSDGGGPNATTSLQTQYKIDNNSDFWVKRIEINYYVVAGTAFSDTTLTLLAKFLNECWFEFYTNQQDRTWFAHARTVTQTPMLVAAAGASAYDPVNVINGGANMNVPVKIAGGQAFSFLGQRRTTTDYSTLGVQIVFWGFLDKAKEIEVQ